MNKKGAKVSRNPAIAYQQGVGRGVMHGIRATEFFALVALYNIADDYVEDEVKRGELFKAYDAELKRIMIDEMTDINNSGSKSDNIDYVMRKVKELYAKLGIEKY